VTGMTYIVGGGQEVAQFEPAFGVREAVLVSGRELGEAVGG
jgi:hypothetical protein